MTAGHLVLGREGEEAAVAALAAAGLSVLERNWRGRRGELDAVCLDGDTLVFVEVKTRAEGSLASGAEAVGGRKRSRVVRAAAEFLSQRGWWHRPCRFDVVSVRRVAGKLVVEHCPEAFEADWSGAKDGGWQPW